MDTLVKPLPSPTAVEPVPVTVIPALVVCNLGVLFQFRVADPPFENVAYVTTSYSFFNVNASDLISDIDAKLVPVATPPEMSYLNVVLLPSNIPTVLSITYITTREIVNY